jgi:hypothetical protein
VRKLGNVLMLGGAGVGFGVGVAMLSGIHFVGPWLVAVGLTKLILLGSCGLMATGAVCIRLANRDDERKSLAAAQRELPPL